MSLWADRDFVLRGSGLGRSWLSLGWRRRWLSLSKCVDCVNRLNGNGHVYHLTRLTSTGEELTLARFSRTGFSLYHLALFPRGVGGESLLHAAGEVRSDAQDALDQHQLAAVMHFVFFDGEKQIEACARWRSPSLRHGYDFAEEIVVKPFEPLGPCLAILGQEFDHLRLRARRFFFRPHARHQRWKVESIEIEPPLLGVDFSLKRRSERDVRQQLSNAARLRHGPKIVLVFRDVLRNREGVLPNG